MRLARRSAPTTRTRDADTDEDLPLRHVAVPFGPFLAAGAVVFLFAESWLQVRLGVLWGMV